MFGTELVLCILSKNEKSLLVTSKESVNTEEAEDTLVLIISMTNRALLISHEASETQKIVKNLLPATEKYLIRVPLGIYIF